MPELLKLIFGKNDQNKWAIECMTGVPLLSKAHDEENFYQIEDDIVVNQPSFLGTRKFILGQSIVPIVARVQGENVLRCLGTGFFVSCSGLLITAAHVVSDPIERKYGGLKEIDELTWHAEDMQLGVMIPINPLLQGNGYVIRSIEWSMFLSDISDHPLPFAGVNLKLITDTAICKVAPIGDDIPHQPLAIIQPGMAGLGMDVGKSAIAVGYGAMRDVKLSAESQNIVTGDFYFDMHASTGKILERFPENITERNVPTPGPCFSASLKLPGGMSGSPIFDDEGIYVHGVVSKGWEDENGLASLGYGSMLAPSMHLPIKYLDEKSIFELYEDDSHGFAKVSGPGI